MKRDMDFIREILLRLEVHNGDTNNPPNLSDTGKSQLEIAEHYRLLENQGFIEAINYSSMSGALFLPQRITWQGHDFLDSIRDEEIWKMTKEGAEKAGGFTLEILGALAKGFVKKQIEKQTGVDL